MGKTPDVRALAVVDLSKAVAAHLSPCSCEAWAKRTGFQRREPRKITGALLLRSLSALAFSSRCSLERLASVIGYIRIVCGSRKVSSTATVAAPTSSRTPYGAVPMADSLP